jgi:(2Fe-2S) ferredoxin
MAKPQRHVFICTQNRPPDHPRGSCAAVGASAVAQAFWQELQKRNCFDKVAVTTSGCIGTCSGGPSVVVYPEGVMYQKVSPADVAEIFDQHLIGGEPVARLLAPAEVWS